MMSALGSVGQYMQLIKRLSISSFSRFAVRHCPVFLWSSLGLNLIFVKELVE